jgi:hypothetical protein
MTVKLNAKGTKVLIDKTAQYHLAKKFHAPLKRPIFSQGRKMAKPCFK